MARSRHNEQSPALLRTSIPQCQRSFGTKCAIGSRDVESYHLPLYLVVFSFPLVGTLAMTDSFISVFNQGWVGSIVGIVGLGIGIISFAYTVMSGGRSKAGLAYQAEGQTLIEDSSGILPDAVEVRYEGQRVSRLTLVQLRFWNSGRRPIKCNDLVESDPIVFDFGDGANILKCEIESITRQSIGCRIELCGKKSNKIRVRFDFLDQQDGMLVNVFHTGRYVIPAVTGSVIGVPYGVENYQDESYIIDGPLGKGPNSLSRKNRSNAAIRVAIGSISTFIGLTLMASSIMFYLTILSPKSGISNNAILPSLVLATCIALLALLAIYMGTSTLLGMRRRYPKILASATP